MKNNPPEIEGFLTTEEAAKILNVNKTIFYGWQKRDILNITKIGKYSYVRKIDIDIIKKSEEERIAAALAKPPINLL